MGTIEIINANGDEATVPESGLAVAAKHGWRPKADEVSMHPKVDVQPMAPGATALPIPQGIPAAVTVPPGMDLSRKNASKRKDIPDVTEYVPPHDPNDVLGSFVSSIRPAEPFREPSLAQFRMDTGSDLGKDSKEYGLYADAKWQQALGDAAANHRSITRVAYRDNNTIGRKVGKALGDAGESALETVGGALSGIGDMATLGLGTKVLPAALEGAGVRNASKVVPSLMDDAPLAASLGEILGSGMGAPGLIGKTAGKAVGLGKTSGIISNALKGAATGATVGVGSRAGEDASDVLAGLLTGGKEGARGAMDAHQNEIGDLLTSGGVGGILGALAGGAGAGYDRLRDEGHNPDLAPAVRIGAKVGMKPSLSGVTIPERMQENLRSPEVHARTAAVNRVAPGLAEDVAAAEQAINQSPEALKMAKYHSSDAGQTRIIPENTAKEVLQTAQQHMGLPYVNDAIHRRALKILFDVSEPGADPVPGQGGRTMSVSEARAYGFDVPEAPGRVAVTPKALTARDIETVADGLDELGKAASGGIPKKAVGKLMRAIRMDRDKLPWDPSLGPSPKATVQTDEGTIEVSGLSALDAQLAAKRRALEEPLRKLGANRTKGIQASDIQDPITQSLLGLYGSAEHAPKDAATLDLIRRYAKDPKLAETLANETAAQRAYPTLMNGAEPYGTFRGSMLKAARLRTDPVLGKLSGRTGGPGVNVLTAPLVTGKLGPGVNRGRSLASQGLKIIEDAHASATLKQLLGLTP